MEKALSAVPVPVALARCADYDAPGSGRNVFRVVGEVLDASGLRVSRGARVLVKPNLVTARALACTDPTVTAAACAWLLDLGAAVTVGDSPGFGRAAAVARTVGLERALKPLGLAVRALDKPVSVPLPLIPGSGLPPPRRAHFQVSRRVLDSDLILSVPRFKAHGQMLLTLSVKNCFGCVCGLHKAVVHTRQGQEPDFFADCLAALWAALPPVAGLADGICAMHVTGPSRGRPFALGLLGASSSAVALDEALYAVLGLPPQAVPLGAALQRRKAAGCAPADQDAVYPLLQPKDFDARGFELPSKLAHTSFHPARFVKSCFRRLWAAMKH